MYAKLNVAVFSHYPYRSGTYYRFAKWRCLECLTRLSLWWTTVPTWLSLVVSRWSVMCWRRVELKESFLWLPYPSPSGPVLWSAPWSTAGSSMTSIQRTKWLASCFLFLTLLNLDTVAKGRWGAGNTTINIFCHPFILQVNYIVSDSEFHILNSWRQEEQSTHEVIRCPLKLLKISRWP